MTTSMQRAAVVLWIASLSCSARPSSLVVRIDSDLGAEYEPGGRLRSVRIIVRRTFDQQTTPISLNDPIQQIPGDHLVWFAASAEERRVSVEVIGTTTDTRELHQRWNVEVPSGETRMLRVFLAATCVGHGECPSGSNCGRSGECEADTSDPLGEYSPLVARDAGTLADTTLDAACLPPDDAGDAGSCWTVPTCRSICPSIGLTNRGRWRVTQLQFVQPTGLANDAITGVLREFLARGSTLLGISFDGSSMALRAGGLVMTKSGRTGLGLIDAQYRYYRADDVGLVPSPVDPRDWTPVEIPLRPMGDHLSSGETVQTLRIINRREGIAPTVLQAANVQVSEFRGSEADECLGAALQSGRLFNECSSLWTAENSEGRGVLEVEGLLSVSSVRSIGVFAQGRTVCAIVAGTPDCETVPMSRWTNQPDAVLNGEPAWRLRARISAVRANIEDGPMSP